MILTSILGSEYLECIKSNIGTYTIKPGMTIDIVEPSNGSLVLHSGGYVISYVEGCYHKNNKYCIGINHGPYASWRYDDGYPYVRSSFDTLESDSHDDLIAMVDIEDRIYLDMPEKFNLKLEAPNNMIGSVSVSITRHIPITRLQK